MLLKIESLLMLFSFTQYDYLPEPYKAFENGMCVQKDSRYSKLACETECLHQSLVEMCNCVDFRFRNYQNGECLTILTHSIFNTHHICSSTSLMAEQNYTAIFM